MKHNVLVVVDSFNGGAGNMAQILTQFLQKNKNNNVKLLLMNPNHSKSRYGFDQNDEKQAIYFYSGKTKKNAYIIKAIKFIRQVIKKYEIDTVVSFLDNNNTIVGLSLFFNKKIRLIVSERSNPVVIPPSNKMWTILRRIAYRRANVVSVQFDEFKVFDKGRFEKKCFETPNIILSSPYRRSVEQKDVIRFISCARFAKIKRFDLLIELFAKIHEQNSNTELVLCGDGPEKEKIINLINQYNLKDCVKLLGIVSNTYEVLKDCDIYLMTSLQEGFPNALSEAMASGLPAVVFKCHEGISKLVQNSVNGYCVNDKDCDKFIEKCVYLSLNYDLINKYGEESIKIANKYSPDKVLSIWESIIFEGNC